MQLIHVLSFVTIHQTNVLVINFDLTAINPEKNVKTILVMVTYTFPNLSILYLMI